MDLGALFGAQAPAQPAAPDPGLKAEWDGWLQNPANRAGVLSFGLQLMTGGWGGGASNIAQALGAGVEAAAGTQATIDAEARKNQTEATRVSENAKDRALRRELNQQDNDAAMARTKAGAGQARQDAIFASLVKAAEDKQLKLQSKIAEIDGDLILSPEEKAAAKGPMLKELERFSDPVGYAESVLARRAGGANAGGETSGISAGTAAGGDSAQGASALPAPTSAAPAEGALNGADLLAGLSPEKKAVFDQLPLASQQAFLAQLQAKRVQAAGAGLQALPGAMAPSSGNSTLNWLMQNLAKGPRG